MSAINAVSTALREAYLKGVRDYFLDAKTTNGRIRIYSGTRPADGAALGGSNVLLAEIVLDKPSGAISTGALVLVSTSVTLCANNGTAAWARVVDGDGGYGFDCDVGAVGSGKAIELDELNLLAGGKVVLVSGKLQ